MATRLKTKICGSCKLDLPISEYYKRNRIPGVKNKLSNYFHACKKCINIRNKRNRKLKYKEYAETTKKRLLKNKPHIVEITKRWRETLRNMALLTLGNKCCKCGYSDKRALQIDHILGNGGKERRELNYNQFKIYKKISSGSNEYQLLCANCNWIKRYENNELKRS